MRRSRCTSREQQVRGLADQLRRVAARLYGCVPRGRPVLRVFLQVVSIVGALPPSRHPGGVDARRTRHDWRSVPQPCPQPGRALRIRRMARNPWASDSSSGGGRHLASACHGRSKAVKHHRWWRALAPERAGARIAWRRDGRAPRETGAVTSSGAVEGVEPAGQPCAKAKRARSTSAALVSAARAMRSSLVHCYFSLAVAAGGR